MKPFYVLIVVFVLSLAGTFLAGGAIDWKLSGRIAMSVMLLFTALGHFKFPDGMARMIPPFIPERKMLVILSGLFEVVAALGLLFPATQEITRRALIVFFVLILPANIFAAIKKLNYQTGNYDGPGLSYLWIRVPLQLLFIWWVWFF